MLSKCARFVCVHTDLAQKAAAHEDETAAWPEEVDQEPFYSLNKFNNAMGRGSPTHLHGAPHASPTGGRHGGGHQQQQPVRLRSAAGGSDGAAPVRSGTLPVAVEPGAARPTVTSLTHRASRPTYSRESLQLVRTLGHGYTGNVWLAKWVILLQHNVRFAYRPEVHGQAIACISAGLGFTCICCMHYWSPC